MTKKAVVSQLREHEKYERLHRGDARAPAASDRGRASL